MSLCDSINNKINDEMIMTFNILLITLLSVSRFGNIIGVLRSEGFCNRYESQYVICCRHYEFVRNKCKACEVGYLTDKEGREKCKSCPPYEFGQKCVHRCKCKAYESCDNKNGTCTPWTTTFSEYWNHTRYQTQSTEESESINDVNLTKATSNYALLIYMICAGFIILVLCAVAAVYKHRKNVNNVPKCTVKIEERGSDIPPVPPRSMQHNVLIDLHDNGSVYELIDDENLLNL